MFTLSSVQLISLNQECWAILFFRFNEVNADEAKGDDWVSSKSRPYLYTFFLVNKNILLKEEEKRTVIKTLYSFAPQAKPRRANMLKPVLLLSPHCKRAVTKMLCRGCLQQLQITQTRTAFNIFQKWGKKAEPTTPSNFSIVQAGKVRMEIPFAFGLWFKCLHWKSLN